MTKYQIFISSTFDDLKEERAQVIKAVLEMGHIPVGMEMFSAADEEQWKIITRQIDETDYYVVIVGHKYGSITDGISYTEKEYLYATEKGIPALGFIIDPSIEPLAKNCEKDEGKIAALSIFKNKVKQRPVSFWKNTDDLHGKVSIALMKAFNTTPRVGWTRATAIPSTEIVQEISRLSKENAELRQQIEKAHSKEIIDKKSHLQQKINTLKANSRTIYIRAENETDWKIETKTNLFKIFEQLSPELLTEISTTKASEYLALMNRPNKDIQLSTIAPTPINHVKILFADLASLDLVEPSKKKHPISDTDSYWSLTKEGNELLKLDRITRLEAIAAKSIESNELEKSQENNKDS